MLLFCLSPSVFFSLSLTFYSFSAESCLFYPFTPTFAYFSFSSFCYTPVLLFSRAPSVFFSLSLSSFYFISTESCPSFLSHIRLSTFLSLPSSILLCLSSHSPFASFSLSISSYFITVESCPSVLSHPRSSTFLSFPFALLLYLCFPFLPLSPYLFLSPFILFLLSLVPLGPDTFPFSAFLCQ